MAKDINGKTIKLNDTVICTYRDTLKLLKGKVVGFSPTDRPRIEYSSGNSYYTNSDILIID
jgi:hypothetical protein